MPLWDALIEAGTPHGIVPAGMLALDVARIEAGLMLIDVDYVPARKALIESQTSSPYELDLGWTVNLKKERFVGREALAAEAAREPQWRFVGIEIEWELARAPVRRGRSRDAPAGRRLAHQRADLRRRRAGGLRHERRLVAAAQEVHRARAPARAGRRRARSSRSRSPSSTGASARPPAW